MSEHITSGSNELIKKIRKLQQRKYREREGRYIAEGKRWVEDARKLCPHLVEKVICADDTDCAYADITVPRALMDELCDAQNGQGVLAIMRMPAPTDTFGGTHCLFLDRVRDPGNMGTMIRTACAAGYEDIVLRDCVDAYNPKVIRSCMTGILHVRFHYADSPAVVRKLGYTTVAATLCGENVFAANKPSGKICLVIGNEANGIDASVLRECEVSFTIPMQKDMESLNAAVSAGILMYQLKYAN